MSFKSKIIAGRLAEIYGGPEREVMEVRSLLSGKDVIDLGYGEPDFDTPEHIRKAAKQAIDDGYTHYVLPVSGFSDLRQAIAEKLENENKIKVDPNKNICVTAGVQEGINVVMHTILNPGDEVIIADPCYYTHITAISLAGGIPAQVPASEEREYRIDPEELGNSIKTRTKAILLVSPDNPTTSVLSKEDLKIISEIAVRNDLLVVTDEIYEKLLFDGLKHETIAAMPGMEERTIILNGFSKAYAMCGWRVGYIAAPEHIMRYITGMHSQFVIGANAIAQKAALAALTGPQDSLRKMVSEFQERRDVFVAGLNKIEGIKCKKPKGTYYVYSNIKDVGVSSLEFAKGAAKKANIILYPGTAFGKNGEGYVRFSIVRKVEVLKEYLQRLEKYVESLPS